MHESTKVKKDNRILVTDPYAKVIDILRVEAEAITNAAANLDRGSVESALEILALCEGKAVVIGVGKSGVIAQKIAQTLTSTGTTAVFVQASDALHCGARGASGVEIVVAPTHTGRTGGTIGHLPP